MTFRARLSVLLVLLVLEMLLVYSLLQRGWNQTTDTLYWLRAIAIAGIPIVIAVSFLLLGRFRISIRTLLILTACVAIFISMAMLPLIRAKQNRRGTRELTLSGAIFETESFSRPMFRGIEPQTLDSGLGSGTETVENELADWILPLSGDITDTPRDDEILEVRIENRQQWLALLKNAERFSSLESVIFWGSDIRTRMIEEFTEHLKKFPRLTTVHVGQVEVTNSCLSKMTGVKCLSLRYLHPAIPIESHVRLSPEKLDTISQLPSLQILINTGYGLSDADLIHLAPSSSLRLIMAYESNITPGAVEEFQKLNPNCEVYVH